MLVFKNAAFSLKITSLLIFFPLLFISCNNDSSQTTINPEEIPEGMVFIPGGTTTIGSNEGAPNEQPVFETRVNAFLMDKNLVTVAQFKEFIETTGYITEAEEFGNGVVFDFEIGEWILGDGVNWEYPNGPDAEPAENSHPVRQVSFRDASEYLAWAGKRLPTEFEWEHAARGGKNNKSPYAWGESLIEQGQYRANTWTGTFPVENVADDGYLQTSPVGEFNITELGLTDMGGNVWEWTDSWYRPYSLRDQEYTPTAQSEKVLRGGSFMCNVSYCHGYRVSARSNTTPDNSLFHVGFRGVKDLN